MEPPVSGRLDSLLREVVAVLRGRAPRCCQSLWCQSRRGQREGRTLHPRRGSVMGPGHPDYG
eukprot:6449183-Alexandrium_andersonii.AAC.1